MALLIADYDGNISALDSATGAIDASSPFHELILAPPSFAMSFLHVEAMHSDAANNVYIALVNSGGNPEVRKYDVDANLLWKVGAAFTVTPNWANDGRYPYIMAVGADRIALGTDDGAILLDASDGSSVWSTADLSSPYGYVALSGSAAAGDLTVIVSHYASDDKLRVYNIAGSSSFDVVVAGVPCASDGTYVYGIGGSYFTSYTFTRWALSDGTEDSGSATNILQSISGVMVLLGGAVALTAHDPEGGAGYLLLMDIASGGITSIYPFGSGQGAETDPWVKVMTGSGTDEIYTAAQRYSTVMSDAILSGVVAWEETVASASGWFPTGIVLFAALTPAPTMQFGIDRIRSSVSEDAGSILDATTLLATDLGLSEDFLLKDEFNTRELKAFSEALRTSGIALVYYPAPTQNTEYLNTYDGTTKLGRMTRTYPPGLMSLVKDIPALAGDLVDGVRISAQAAIRFVFASWQATYPWFTFEAIPDLRYHVPSGSYAGREGVLYTEVISIPQPEDARLTMRDITDQFLAAFPGTIIRQNAAGNVELVPAVGPDAPLAPIVTLDADDAYTLSAGAADPRGIINKATFTNTPYAWGDDVPVMQPAWMQAHSIYMDMTVEAFTPASGRLSISGTDDENDFTKFQPKFWPANPTAIQGDSINWANSYGVLQLSGGVKFRPIGAAPGTAMASDVLSDSNFTSNLHDLPTDGSFHDVFNVRYGIIPTFSIFEIDYLLVAVEGRWVSAGGIRGIQLRFKSATKLEANAGGFQVAAIFEIYLNDASRSATADLTNTATFGRVDDSGSGPDFIPGGGAGNAIKESQDAYGIVEATVAFTVFTADPVQLQEMAMSFVLANIQPKLVRSLEQSVWRSFPVEFDHVGRLVKLPGDEVGVVMSRSYADDFGAELGPGSMSSAIRVQILDANGAGAIDGTTRFIGLGDGQTYLGLGDGSLLGV